MKRWLGALVVGSLMVTGCGSDDDDESAASASTTPPATSVITSVTATTAVTVTQAPATSTTVSATRPTTTGQAAARAIIGPDTVAGLGMGASKTQVIAVLGEPTTRGQETDLSGATYDYLRWQFSGLRGLALNFRTESVTSPLLTDWTATAAGPVTTGGVQVGDTAAKAIAAHGALQPFCCGAQVASETKGVGRMVVVVASDIQQVTQIIGGDPGYWSRSVAD